MFGSDWSTPCERYAVETLNSEATLSSAYSFFQNLTSVQDNMTTALTTVLNETCYATLQTLQIQSYTLPSDFNTAIENSTLVTQQIQTA